LKAEGERGEEGSFEGSRRQAEENCRLCRAIVGATLFGMTSNRSDLRAEFELSAREGSQVGSVVESDDEGERRELEGVRLEV